MSSPIAATVRIAGIIIVSSFLFACEGDDGAPGPAGPQGSQGVPGPIGNDGPPADASIKIGDGSNLSPEEIETFGKLQATITNVSVDSAPVVEFTVLDQNGNPAVGLSASAVRFTFAKLVPGGDPNVNGGLAYWQSYLNRVSTPDGPEGVLATAIQATNDRSENEAQLEELGPGSYRYTFTNDVTIITDPISVAWEDDLTHRVGMEIRLSRGSGARRPMAPDNPVFDFVPDGSAGSGETKNIADTDNCAGCHFEFTEHGGQRKTVEYCVTCHNPGSVDPNSGESVDMAYLAHSIHMGHDRAVPYIVDGDDFSEVHYPQSQTYCETCHVKSLPSHPDGDNWNEKASAKSCGGCHADGLVATNVDPVTGQAEYLFDHAVADLDLGSIEDGECAACHLGAIGSAGPALSIHSRISGDRRFREELGRNFILEILDATDTGPGQTPVITFKVSRPDGTPYDIVNDPEFNDGSSSLNLYVAWSTDDIYNGDELGATGSLRDRNRDISDPADGIADLEPYATAHPHRMYLAALQRDIAANPDWVNADGSYTVTFFTSIPANISGDAMISLGGHPAAVNVEDADNVVGSQRAASVSAVYFPGTERQVAFDSDKCNDCHQQIQFHGSNRNGNVTMCLNCHNADLAEGGEGFAFGRMIHSIHAASTSFAGGEFAEVRFPQNIANCDACHVAGSYAVARLTARAVSIDGGADEASWLDDAATTPTAANCGACHNDIASMAHFNTQGGQVGAPKSDILTVGGLPNGQEACAVCHGAGSEFDTARYHNPGVE